MKFLPSEQFDRSNNVRLLHTGPRLSQQEGREIFREMVRAEARNGALSQRRRRRLIQYAAALQLKPLEASRIVTDVYREFEYRQTRELAPSDAPAVYRFVEAAAIPARWPVWIKISITLLAAFSIDRLLRWML